MKQVVHTGKYVSTLYRMIITYMSEKLKQFNLSNVEYAYLMILYEEDFLSLDELTKRSLVDKSQTTRGVKLLQEKGFVEKHRNKNDGRSFIVSLTNQGKALAPKIYSEIVAFETVLNSDIPYERQKQLKKDLIKMMKNLKEDSYE